LKSQHAKKRLRVCETVSLGEKRFVAVIQVDGEQFLVGGSSSSVSTLAHLESAPQFSDVLRQQARQDMSQA
jgi:flagellar biogenesis protein FliO